MRLWRTILVASLLLLPVQGHATSINLDEVREAALAGDPDAQFVLGQFYSGVYEPGYPDFEHQLAFGNLEEARRWLGLAADQGHPGAMLQLGFICEHGLLEVSVDKVCAYMWWSLAIEHGDGSLQGRLDRLSEEMTADQRDEGQRLVEDWMRTH